MHHVCAPKRLLTGLLAFVLTAMLVQAAAAAPQVIPYLSHGIGVDNAQYRYHDGEWIPRSSTKAPLVIPYLSHGVGVDQSLYSGKSHQLRRTAATPATHKAVPDAFERMLARHEAMNRALAVRPDNRAGVRGIATRTYQASTAVRPDDRAGFRGIGGSASNTVSVSASNSSSSDTWSKVLYAVGGFLALLLVAGGAIALGRRQPKRLATR
jgi:hypothetical protein